MKEMGSQRRVFDEGRWKLLVDFYCTSGDYNQLMYKQSQFYVTRNKLASPSITPMEKRQTLL